MFLCNSMIFPNESMTKSAYIFKNLRYYFFSPLKHIDVKGASGMIKFLTGSCLSELGIVLKEPSAIYFYG